MCFVFYVYLYSKGFPRLLIIIIIIIISRDTVLRANAHCVALLVIKDVHRKQVKYFTAVVCTPLTLLQDIENGTVEVYKVLYLRTLTITVDTFLCCELARFVNEHPTPIVRRHLKRVILPLGFRYPNTDHITWKSRNHPFGTIRTCLVDKSICE